jgi:hypothetical protein
MDPISAIFVMTVLGGLFVKGVDVATDGLFSAEVGAGIRGAAGFAGRDVRDRWARANEKAREIRSRTRSGRMVQGILDDAAAFGRTGWLVGRALFGEARRFGSGARSEWETARDQARSARTERRGEEPWPIVRAARSGAVRAREWAEQRSRSDADDPNEAEPFDPTGASSDPEPEPNTTTAIDPNERRAAKTWEPATGCLFVLDWHDEDERRRPDFCGKDREEGWVYCPKHMREARAETYQSDDLEELRAEGDPNAPNEDPNRPWEQPGTDAYLPPRPGDPTRQPIRVEIYRAYVERGQRDVRADVRRLDTGASYHAVKGHDYRSGERGWTTFHTTPWLPSMAAVVAEVRATVLDDLGRMRVPYRIEWFIDGEPNAQPAGQPADGDPNDPNGPERRPSESAPALDCPENTTRRSTREE